MYVIGKDKWDLIIVKMATMYDGRRLYQEVEEIIYNIHNNQCTIFNNYEDAIKILDIINNCNNKIKITNDSIIDSILDGNLLDITTLKIYELIPTEVNI